MLFSDMHAFIAKDSIQKYFLTYCHVREGERILKQVIFSGEFPVMSP